MQFVAFHFLAFTLISSLGLLLASLSRLAEGRVDGLEDLELDAGLSLLLLRGRRAEDLLGLRDTVADGLGLACTDKH